MNIFRALLLTSTYLAVLISIRAHEHQVAGAYLLGLEISTLYCVQGSQCVFSVLTMQVLETNHVFRYCPNLQSFSPPRQYVGESSSNTAMTQQEHCLDCDSVDVEEQQLAQHFILDNNADQKV